MIGFEAVGRAALDAMGQDCVWTPEGGTATPVRLMIVEGTRLDNTLNYQAGNLLDFSSAAGAASDLAGIKRGDLILDVVSGKTSMVGTVSPDGRGMIRFDLREAT